MLEQLILEVYRLNIGSPLDTAAGADADDSSDDDDGRSEERCLVVEQVRVTDTDAHLKVVYPSRADLVDIGVVVKRD